MMSYARMTNDFTFSTASANAGASFGCALLHLILDAVLASFSVLVVLVHRITTGQKCTVVTER